MTRRDHGKVMTGLFVASLAFGGLLLTTGSVEARPEATAATARPALSEARMMKLMALQDAAEQLGEEARERVEPLAEGEVKILQAVVMDVQGRAQWRVDKDAPWQTAKLDDMLEPGTKIRTARRSKLTLRVGQNATILVDRNTIMTLPEVVQTGATLRTSIQLERGRADFKVDRVGLTNDFTVVTPSTTLAVQGTGFGVMFGGLKGTEIAASRFNEMFAIEVRYFISRMSYAISGGGTSTEKFQNPAVKALFKTFGPPPVMSALIESDATPEALYDELSRSPVYDLRSQDLVQQARDAVDDFIDIIEPPEMEMIPEDPMMMDPEFDFGEIMLTAGEVAEFLCNYTFEIFGTWSMLLERDMLGTNNLSMAEEDFIAICDQVFMEDRMFEEQDLVDLLEVVVEYCHQEHPYDTQPAEFDICVEDFVEAVIQIYQMPPK